MSTPNTATTEESRQFDVVVNDEEQYSIWAVGRPVPDGWHLVGVHGSQEQCLDHIEKVWTDMRPKTLRERIAATETSIAEGNSTDAR